MVEAHGRSRGPGVQVVVAQRSAQRMVGLVAEGFEEGRGEGLCHGGRQGGVDLASAGLAVEEGRHLGVVGRAQDGGPRGREAVDRLVGRQQVGRVVGVGYRSAGEQVLRGHPGQVVGAGHGGGRGDGELVGVVGLEFALESQGRVSAVRVADEEKLTTQGTGHPGALGPSRA